MNAHDTIFENVAEELDASPILDDTAYLLASLANANRLHQAIAEVENQTLPKQGTPMYIETEQP